MIRNLKISGHLFFLVLLAFAVLFSKERVLFVDSAYYLFKIINFESLNIEYLRFPSVFTQLLTWLGVKEHLPLTWLILCFSVSFIFVYYIIFLISVYVFRNIAAGLAIAFVLCLSIRHSYFHIVTETHQALVYSCLFFAWIMFQKKTLLSDFDWKRAMNILIGAVIICFAGYSHPVAYICIIFCLGYYWIEKKQYDNSLPYVMFALTILLGAFKYFTTPAGTYEGQFLSQIARADEVLMNYSSLFSRWFYNYHFKELYRLPFWITVVTTVYYLLTSRFKKMLFVPAFYFGFLIFAQIVFNAVDSRLMMERAFMPLAFFAAIPFLNDVVLGNLKFVRVKLAVVILLLAFSMRGIYKAGEYFSDRISYMDQLFEDMDDHQKMLINWENTTHDLIYIPWAFAVETLMYSASKEEDDQKTVYVSNEPDLNVPINDPNLFLCVHFDKVWDTEKLNSKYFSLPREKYFIETDSVLFTKRN